LPLEAQALIEIARLRVEALRVGLSEIVNLRKEVRLAPVGLSASQEVRLERLAPKAVLRDGVLFVPLPRPDPVAGMIDFLRQMWPGEGPPLTAPGLERAAN
jgi:transcription-repair coupling factor (superfamily II helicase)